MTSRINTFRKAHLYRSGSFWYDHVNADQRDLVRAMFHSGDLSDAELALQSIPVSISPTSNRDVWHTVIKFDASSQLSIVLNPGTRTRVPAEAFTSLPVPRVFESDNTAGLILNGVDPEFAYEQGSVLLVPYTLDSTRWTEMGYTAYSYFVKNDSGVSPTIITAASHTMFSGTDFHNVEHGIVFKEDPVILFPDSRIHVRHGVQTATTIFPYSSGVDATDCPGLLINRYLRATQGPLDLAGALNEVLGLDGFPTECEILHVTACQDDTVLYSVHDGRNEQMIRIRQPHDRMAPGQRLPAACVPNPIVRLYCHATAGDKWFNVPEIPVNGLPAKGMLPLSAEEDRIPPGPIQVQIQTDGRVSFCTGSMATDGLSSIIRARFPDTFDQYVAENMVAGKFDLLGFLFEYVWKYTAAIITYDERRTTASDIQRLNDFLYRNQPVNAILFLLPV